MGGIPPPMFSAIPPTLSLPRKGGGGPSAFTLSASITAITKPGNPAPEPMSTQVLRGGQGSSWAESAKWRCQMASSVLGATRLMVFCQWRRSRLVGGQAIQRFPGDMEGRGKVIRSADGARLMLVTCRLGHAACIAGFPADFERWNVSRETIQRSIPRTACLPLCPAVQHSISRNPPWLCNVLGFVYVISGTSRSGLIRPSAEQDAQEKDQGDPGRAIQFHRERRASWRRRRQGRRRGYA